MTTEQEARVISCRYLAIGLAKKFQGKLPGYDICDGIGLAMLVLCRSALTWDDTRGVKFSTYASKAIHTELNKNLHNLCSVIQVPTSTTDNVRRWKSGKEFSAKVIETLLKASKDFPQQLSVLEKPRQKTETLQLEDQHIDQDKRLTRLLAAIDRLPDRERVIITKRFGIGDRQHYLHELGEELNLTKERVRQLEAKGLRRLREMLDDEGESSEGKDCQSSAGRFPKSA